VDLTVCHVQGVEEKKSGGEEEGRGRWGKKRK